MTMTPEQDAAISTLLSTDLATVTNSRLIELCLLYRAAPSALPTFTDALKAEITRRFTAAEIASNDVMFSVLQNFLNNFDPLNGYQDRLYGLSTIIAGQRDNWFRDNATFFYAALHNPVSLAWLVGNAEIMGYVAASNRAMNAVIASDMAITAVAESNVSMTAVAAATIAMTAVTSSSAAMTVVASSSIAMGCIASSNAAMTIISTSNNALSKIVTSSNARTALVENNTVFQSFKENIFNTVKTNWTLSKHLYIDQTNINLDIGVSYPNGFVFAHLGKYEAGYPSTMEMLHYNNTSAATGSTRNLTELKRLTAPVDGVSFNTARLRITFGDYPRAILELWKPPI